jgi:peptide-methionine (R)-S-oxide reductase
MTTLKAILITLFAGILQQCSYSQNNSSTSKKENMDSVQKKHTAYSNTDTAKVNVSDSEWEKVLPKDVFYVARKKGTERPWTSPLEKVFDKGTYYCAVCGNALFQSDTKFESGCGWPAMSRSAREVLFISRPHGWYDKNRGTMWPMQIAFGA